MSPRNKGTFVSTRGGTLTIGNVHIGDNHPAQQAPTAVASKSASGDRARLRRRIDEVLRGDVDLESFCLDHFDEIYRRMTPSMERGAKVNLLLSYADPHILEARLAAWEGV